MHFKRTSLAVPYTTAAMAMPATRNKCITILQCKSGLLLKTSRVYAEAVASAMPATAAKAQLLLDLAARKPQDGLYASWVLPLAATALLNAAPPAAPHLWLQVRSLAFHSLTTY